VNATADVGEATVFNMSGSDVILWNSERGWFEVREEMASFDGEC
jgi:hypothetical protein